MWAGSIQSIQGSKKWLLRRGLRPTSRGIRPNSEKTFWKTPGFFIRMTSGSVSKPCTPVVHIKIAGKWMFIPLKMVLTGIDPYPSLTSPIKPSGSSRCCSPKLAGRWIIPDACTGVSQQPWSCWTAELAWLPVVSTGTAEPRSVHVPDI